MPGEVISPRADEKFPKGTTRGEKQKLIDHAANNSGGIYKMIARERLSAIQDWLDKGKPGSIEADPEADKSSNLFPEEYFRTAENNPGIFRKLRDQLVNNVPYEEICSTIADLIPVSLSRTNLLADLRTFFDKIRLNPADGLNYFMAKYMSDDDDQAQEYLDYFADRKKAKVDYKAALEVVEQTLNAYDRWQEIQRVKETATEAEELEFSNLVVGDQIIIETDKPKSSSKPEPRQSDKTYIAKYLGQDTRVPESSPAAVYYFVVSGFSDQQVYLEFSRSGASFPKSEQLVHCLKSEELVAIRPRDFNLRVLSDPIIAGGTRDNVEEDKRFDFGSLKSGEDVHLDSYAISPKELGHSLRLQEGLITKIFTAKG